MFQTKPTFLLKTGISERKPIFHDPYNHLTFYGFLLFFEPNFGIDSATFRPCVPQLYQQKQSRYNLNSVFALQIFHCRAQLYFNLMLTTQKPQKTTNLKRDCSYIIQCYTYHLCLCFLKTLTAKFFPENFLVIVFIIIANRFQSHFEFDCKFFPLRFLNLFLKIYNH